MYKNRSISSYVGFLEFFFFIIHRQKDYRIFFAFNSIFLIETESNNIIMTDTTTTTTAILTAEQ